jgi:hypothetical protein
VLGDRRLDEKRRCHLNVIHRSFDELVMNVSVDEAVTMYARFCHAWYGGRAEQVARGRIQHLRRKGDTKGVEGWEKLVRELTSSSPHGPRGGTRPHKLTAISATSPKAQSS